MKTIKSYIAIVLLITSSASFAQKITVNINDADVFLVIKEVKISIKDQEMSKTTNNGITTYSTSNSESSEVTETRVSVDNQKIIKTTKNGTIKYTPNRKSNVVCNAKSNFKFIVKNTKNIKIIQLNDNYEISSTDLKSNEIKYNKIKNNDGYEITIPKIEKGIYAIIRDDSLNWNVFEIN